MNLDLHNLLRIGLVVLVQQPDICQMWSKNNIPYIEEGKLSMIVLTRDTVKKLENSQCYPFIWT